MSYPKEYSNNLILPSKRWQSLHRRLVVLLGGVLPVTILIIVFTVSLFLPPIEWETWLLFSGAVFLLGLVGIWATNRILRQYTIQSLEEFQPELEEVSEDKVSLAVAAVDERNNDFGNHKIQGGLRKAELATEATESRQTVAELEEIKAEFRQFSQVNFEGIAIHHKINIMDANEALANMFGYQPSEIIGMTALSLSTPESRSIVLRNILSKYEKPFEAIGIKRDGTTFPIEILSRAISHQGQMIRVMGIRELTEREPAEVMRTLQEAKKELEAEVKRSTTELRYANERLQLELKGRQQAEDALQESEERYRQLVEFSPDGIIIHTEDKIAFINAAGAKILGATEPEQLIGKRIIDFVYLDDQRVIEERLRQVNGEKQRMSPIQQKFIRLDGTTAEVEVIDIPFAYKNRPAVQLVVRDITERKKAEVEIAQRNRELTILQAAGVAITSRLDLRYVLDTVAQEMAQLLEVECCAIFEWDQTENTTTQIARYGSQGWWDSNSKAEVYSLAEYPLTKSILEEQIPEQMTISRHNIDPFELDYMKRANLKTLLMLPMIFQRRVLGLVKLEESRVERIFTHQEISLAKLLASQAASAIENARLFDELHQRVAELMTLNEINQAITSTLDLQEMLTIINEHIIQLLNVVTSSVVLYDEVESSLWVAAVSGEGSNLVRGKRLPLGEGVVGWVIEHSKAVLVPDISKDARFDSIFKQEHSFVIRSILCVPLQAKGKTIGAVEVINKADELFDQADLRLLQSVAAPAATAIDNARLFEQAQDEIGERLRAETALEEERALLVQRVKERTAELSKANAELARASRLKDEFLAGMSHELRTPLNSILGFSEILQMGAFGELNERQLKYTSNIEESGRHLLLLINDILDISKVEAGKLELEIRPVSVESVCQASLRLVKELAHQKQLKVSTTFNNIITVLQADERRLKQILVNLLSNAIKFTPEGGEIGLEVGEDTEKQVIHFTVWDTGIGISREDMSQLFQPFVQLDSSLARQYAGTGLGLSLVLRLVELHRGGVSMESEVGQGSRFTVSLPYSGWAVLASPTSGIQPAIVDKPAVTIDQKLKIGEHPLILLTDDNEDNINMILEFLQVQGYQVITARNGSEAIVQAREEKPDVILMDIRMPGMDGLEATRRLRADADLANIPIIALTALAMPGDQERCLEAGANEYLSKPVSPSELVKKIETFLK